MDLEHTLNILASLVSILGLPIFISTAILLVRQLRVQTYEAIYESVLPIDQYLLENPSLRKYLYSGQALPDSSSCEYDRVVGLADMMLTFFEHLLGQKNSMTKRKWLGWENYMRAVYKSSPAVQYFLKANREWYTDELKGVLGSN